MARRFAAVIFLATPHRGTNFADLLKQTRGAIGTAMLRAFITDMAWLG
jgi:triacylglycerol esterase/lipase EstA (alpha/beta hydrolase family)